MDSDQGKLFIGGISWETTEEKLKDYFGSFGEVTEAVIMRDRATGRARGFGFVVFSDPMVSDMVVLEKHNIDGRLVEAKKAVPREEQQNVNRNSSANVGGSNSMIQSNPSRTKKIFVGGLASTVTESDFRSYFGQFGTITDVVVMYDHGTQRPRGFGFITYDSEDAVDRVLQRTFHELNDKMVEVKRAVPKDASSPSSNRNNVGLTTGPGRSGNYTSGYSHMFNTSPISSYAMRMDGRYSPSPSNHRSTNYLPYATVGYGSPANYSGSSINGTQNFATYGSGGYYRSGGPRSTSSGSNVAYGSIGGGFGSNNHVSYGNSPGRNVWSTGGNSYGSIGNQGGFVAGSGSTLNSYNAISTWGSSPTHSNSSAGYGSQNYGGGYGGGDGPFINSNNSRYEGQNSGFGSSVADLGGSRWGSGSNSSFGNIYGSSVYNDSTWRVTPADALNSGRSGSGAFHFSFNSDNNGEEDISTTDGGYGASRRQSYREGVRNIRIGKANTFLLPGKFQQGWSVTALCTKFESISDLY